MSTVADKRKHTTAANVLCLVHHEDYIRAALVSLSTSVAQGLTPHEKDTVGVL